MFPDNQKWKILQAVAELQSQRGQNQLLEDYEVAQGLHLDLQETRDYLWILKEEGNISCTRVATGAIRGVGATPQGRVAVKQLRTLEKPKMVERTDKELRTIVLYEYYKRRREDGVWANRDKEFCEGVSGVDALRISEQLADLGLIEFEALRGDDVVQVGYGNITAQGVNVIESKEGSDSRTSRSSLVRVLLLAANPTDTDRLRLDEESRNIDQALRRAEHRDKFDVRPHFAVRVTDLQELFLRYQPHIVHFSGHGSSASEIVLEDGNGYSHPVTPRALSQVFSILKDNIQCVVLNACYSERQAEAIAQHINCVVGMTSAIGDVAAISFATSFYQALAYGKSVQTAFNLGCVQIDLENIPEEHVPKLVAKRVDPAQVVLVP